MCDGSTVQLCQPPVVAVVWIDTLVLEARRGASSKAMLVLLVHQGVVPIALRMSIEEVNSRVCATKC
eukprot:5084669-Prorocentrum_lima.AAC.1